MEDDIQDIVTSIVRGCNHGGHEVSEILAAFVAKTVKFYRVDSLQTDPEHLLHSESFRWLKRMQHLLPLTSALLLSGKMRSFSAVSNDCLNVTTHRWKCMASRFPSMLCSIFMISDALFVGLKCK